MPFFLILRALGHSFTTYSFRNDCVWEIEEEGGIKAGEHDHFCSENIFVAVIFIQNKQRIQRIV